MNFFRTEVSLVLLRVYDEGQTKSNNNIKSTSYTDIAEKLALAFTTKGYYIFLLI